MLSSLLMGNLLKTKSGRGTPPGHLVEAIASDELIPRIEGGFKKGAFMGAYKDEKGGTWYVSLRYKN